MRKRTYEMRKSWRITALMLAILMLVTSLMNGIGNSVTAQAATTAYGVLSSSKYAKVYTLSAGGTTIPYTSSNLTTRGNVTNGASSKAYIANSTDELYLKKVGTTNGKTWALVSYPTSKKRVDAYIYLSAITNNNGSHAKVTSTGKFYCYPRYTSSSTSSSYYVAKGDSVYLISTSGNKYQIMYNVSSGWRIAWCKKTDYERYCTSSKKEMEISDGCYTLASGLNNSKCMDVSGGKTANGTNIQIWASNGIVSQMFYILKENSGWYSIRDVKSFKAIDVAGGIAKSGVNVQLYEWNGTDAQLWRFYDAGNGYYYIQNKLGYYLDVCGGYQSNGTNIQVYSLNGSAAQKWNIKLADLTKEINKDVFVNLYEDGLVDDRVGWEKLALYYKNFNHKAKYDIKNEKRWNELFTNVKYPGGLHTIFIYNGMKVTPEHLGNIIYGFTGNMMGFSNRTIYQGGGFAAKGTKYLNNEGMYYGDSATDHTYITIGINMSGKKSTIDLDLAKAPSWVLKVAKNIL